MKMIVMVAAMLFVMGAFLPVHTDAFAGCMEDCYKDCCGDEGVCTSPDENQCVSDCQQEFCSNGNASTQNDAGSTGVSVVTSGSGGTSGGSGTGTDPARN